MRRSRTLPRWIALCACALFVALLSAHAAAGGGTTVKNSEAKRHLEVGLRLFREHRYDEAVVEFRAGYAIEENGDFLYALGQAERLRGNCAGAVDAYRGFLDTKPPDAEAQLAAENLRHCEQVLREQAATQPRASEGAAPETRAPQSVPADQTRQPPAPAPHQPGPRAERAAENRGPFYTDAAGDVLASAGLVGAGLAVTFFAIGNHDASAANGAATYDDVLTKRDAAHRNRAIAAVSAGVAVALITAAIVRYATRPAGAKAPASARLPAY